MATIQNFGGQNYNPPMVQAIPSRNWASGTLQFTTGNTIDIFSVDTIVIFRGGPVTTGSVEPDIPGGALNVRVDIQSDQSGINFSPQIDLGDNAMLDIVAAPIVCGNGLTRILLSINGYRFRGRGARIAGSTTTITYTLSVIGY